MSKLTTIRRVAGNGLQAELVDTIQKPGSINVLALANKGDERFNVGSSRRAWFPVTLPSLEEMGATTEQLAKINALEVKEVFELNLNNPKLSGLELRVEIRESIFPDVYQRQNTKKAAKQIMITSEVAKSRISTGFDLSVHIGKNGYLIDEGGNFIFSRATVNVEGQVNHTFVKGTLVPETELGNYGATLAETPVTADVDQN